MVMHRALFTWFLLLVFFILLCLRLEGRTHWNWFLIFLPMWLFDLFLLIDALFYMFVSLRIDSVTRFLKNRHAYLIIIVLLKITAQVTICLKLEYVTLNLQLYHVMIPLWILVSCLIVNVSKILFSSDYWSYCFLLHICIKCVVFI